MCGRIEGGVIQAYVGESKDRERERVECLYRHMDQIFRGVRRR